MNNMKKFDIRIIETEEQTVGFQLLKNIQLQYNKKIGTVNCCPNIILADACIITIKNDYSWELCNNCVFDLLVLLSSFLKQINANEICELKILDDYLILNKAEIKLLVQKFEQYIHYLYDEHWSDRVFDNLSQEKEYFIERWKRPIKLSDEEAEQLKTLSNGLSSEFLLIKKLQNTIKNGEKKKVFSSLDCKTSFVSDSLSVYCVPKDFPCKSSIHSVKRNSVLILANDLIKGFVFSFCSDCLYNFGLTLITIYNDDSLIEYSRGSFKVEHTRKQNANCLFSNKRDKKMYSVHIYNSSFYLCKQYYELLTETIVYSSAFKELYPNEFANFDKIVSKKRQKQEQERINTLNKLNEQAENAIEDCAKEKQLLQDERENYLEEITTLKENCNQLENEITRLEKAIKYYQDDKQKKMLAAEKKAQKAFEIQQKQIAYFSSHILDCSKSRKDILNLGYRSKTDPYKAGLLKTTYMDDFDCKILKHDYKKAAKVILETYRDDDVFCVPACQDCIEQIVKGLKKVGPNNTFYYNFNSKLEVRYLNRFISSKCYSCGSKNGGCYYIRFYNVAFHLCEECRSLWIVQLSKIYLKLNNDINN